MVSRQSPPTDRVVAVLDFLVARRGERFGLSELARGVGLAKPTCLGIVTALTRGGYLVHDAVTKAYGTRFLTTAPDGIGPNNLCQLPRYG